MEAIARRTYIAESIAEAKRSRGLEIDDPERENEVVERVVGKADKLDLDTTTVRRVFRLLIEMNKDMQRDHDG